jgi:DNA ligase (NAD+)
MEVKTIVERIKYLCDTLNKANKAYYQEAKEIMTNYEYDRLYDELVQLEQSTGIILSNSPVHNVGCEIVNDLPKEKHDTPMLSLNKTKSFDELQSWLGTHDGVLSWKLDGLTTVLTYDNGELVKAVTRGNGEIGELITQNVMQYINVPLQIPYKGHLVVRGESVISYHNFEEINSKIPEVNSKYKNPRNLCSGTVRQLDSSIVKERGVKFIAFELVNPVKDYIAESFEWLKNQGFEVVEWTVFSYQNLKVAFEEFKNKLQSGCVENPSDGLVLRYNDYSYGESLGRTDKFPKHSIAFKWADEVAATTLLNIEWKTSRSGLINPVAVFEPVELEGTTVERASLHNISIIEQLQLGIGDEITVYKANMIIPQIAENLTKSGTYQIPITCPECGAEAVIRQDNGKVLYCTNHNCKAKLLAKFTHFVSRDCMNIDGLSEETLSKLIDEGIISSFSDLYAIRGDFKKVNAMMKIPGLGRTSVSNILTSIENSKNVMMDNFINALGIPGIGKKQSKLMAEYFGYDYAKFEVAVFDDNFDFRVLDGFGDVLNSSIHDWYSTVNREQYEWLVADMNFIKPDNSSSSSKLKGKTFVITGTVMRYSNRKEMQKCIELEGGKVTGSVTKNTSYLINNDINSASSKNKKAKELGIPIITEEDLIDMIIVEKEK